MERRKFIEVIAGGILAAPLAADAQQQAGSVAGGLLAYGIDHRDSFRRAAT